MIADKLAQIPLFASLSKHDREQIARAADEVEVQAGKHLAEQGRFAYEFMAIEEGTADVIKDGEKLRELGPGDFFGEIGLLEAERRTATVVATGALQIKEIKIAKEAIDPDDPDMLADMVLAAVNEALRSAQGLMESRLGGMMGGLGGLGLPGL